MGGEGSINGMIISLKNNDLLRRKKSVFRKERFFYSYEPKTVSFVNKPVEIKKLTEEEKAYYRRKTMIEHRSSRIKSLLFFFLLLGFLCTIIALFAL